MISLALLLARHLPQNELWAKPCREESTVQFIVTALDQGVVDIHEECAHSMKLRKDIKPLHPALKWTLKKSHDSWCVHKEMQSDAMALVSSRVLNYFELPSRSTCGLAAARLEPGDRVWRFEGTELGFIVRFESNAESDSDPCVRILGRCYLFAFDGDGEGTVGSHDLRLDLADLYDLAYSATDADYPDKTLAGPLKPAGVKPPYWTGSAEHGWELK